MSKAFYLDARMSTAKGLRWRLAQQLELRWWKRYLHAKDPADYLDWKRAYWRKLLADLEPELALRPGMRVLDAGCGPAGVFTALPLDLDIDAIDPLIESYKRELPDFVAQRPGLRLIASGIESYRTEQRYDCIFCLNAINHVDDIDAGLRRLADLCKPGGTLVLTSDAHRSPWLCRLFRLLPVDVLHPHQYTADSYKRLIEKHVASELILERRLKPGWIFDYQLWLLRLRNPKRR